MSSASSTSPAIDYQGYGLAVLGAALFSTKGIFIKIAYADGASAETLLALRMIVALPFFVAVGLVSLWHAPERAQALHARRLLALAGVGILGYYISSYLDFAGLAFVSAQYERLVLFTYPFLSLAFGVWFFGDKMIRGVVPALVMSYGGLLLIFAWNLSVNPDGLWVGTGLILSAAVTYAFYLHLAKRQMTHVGPSLFTCCAMGAASLAAIAHNTALHGIGQYGSLSGTIWMCGIALGILGTVAPAFVLNNAISRIGARATASTGSYGPIITIVLAVLILGEQFTVVHAVGAALVVGGSIWFGRAEAQAKSR